MTAVKIRKTIGYFDEMAYEPDLRELHALVVRAFGHFAENVSSKRGYGSVFFFEMSPDCYTPKMMLEDFNKFLYCIEYLLIYGKLPEAYELCMSLRTYTFLKDTIDKLLLKEYSRYKLLKYLAS